MTMDTPPHNDLNNYLGMVATRQYIHLYKRLGISCHGWWDIRTLREEEPMHAKKTNRDPWSLKRITLRGNDGTTPIH